MTTKSDKIRGLFLSALMVMSVVAGTAAFAGTAAANHEVDTDAQIGNTSPIFQGQVVLSDTGDWDDDDTVELRSGDPDGENSYEDQLDVENGHVVVDTSGLEGQYYLTDGTNTQQFEVVEQALSVSPDSADATTSASSLDISIDDSNRQSFQINVTADSEGVIAADDADDEGDDSPGFVTTVSEGDAPSIPLSDDLAAGNYTVNVDVVDTDATESITLNVSEAANLDANFAQDVVREERGDVAAITVNLTSTTEADVYVGEDDVNYLQRISVTDGDGDGQVTVLFNTYASGTDDGGDAGDYISAAGEDDSASLDTDYGQTVSSPLASGTYPLNVTESGSPDNELDVATLSIDTRSTDEANSWVAPSISSDADASDVRNAISESDTVAQGQYEVVEVSASGLYGAVAAENAEDISAIDGLDFTVTEVNPGPNADADSFSSSDDGVNTVYDAENDTFFVVIDTDTVSDIETGEWNATFTVSGPDAETQYAVASGTQTVSTVFDVQQPTVELNGGDNVRVPTGETNISGTSNLAPGTSLTVEARAGGNFLKTQRVEVGPDGTFDANFDFSDVDNGTEFTVSTRQGYDDGISGVVDENAGDGEETTTEPDTTTTTTETTTTTTTTETTTTTTTTTETETETETTTTPDDEGGNDGGIPGFGVSVALVAIIAAALLALRRSN